MCIIHIFSTEQKVPQNYNVKSYYFKLQKYKGMLMIFVPLLLLD